MITKNNIQGIINVLNLLHLKLANPNLSAKHLVALGRKRKKNMS